MQLTLCHGVRVHMYRLSLERHELGMLLTCCWRLLVLPTGPCRHEARIWKLPALACYLTALLHMVHHSIMTQSDRVHVVKGDVLLLRNTRIVHIGPIGRAEIFHLEPIEVEVKGQHSVTLVH